MFVRLQYSYHQIPMRLGDIVWDSTFVSNTFSEPVGHILVGNGPVWGLQRGGIDLQQACSIPTQWGVLYTYGVFLWLIIHFIMDDDALKSDKNTHIEQVGCTQVHKRAEIGHVGAYLRGW